MDTQNLEKDLLAVGNMIGNITIAPNRYDYVSPDVHPAPDSMDIILLKHSIIQKIKLEHCVPLYAEVLTRTSDHGIKMENLDSLQQDLETLLSKCALRKRVLLSEATPHSAEYGSIRRNKGNKYQQKQLHLSNKVAKEKSFPKMLKAIRPNTMALYKVYPHETSSFNLSRNGVADNFWQFVEPYCANVTNKDLGFVETLIKESMKDIYVQAGTWNRSSESCPLMQERLTNKESLDKNSNGSSNLSRNIEECVRQLTAIKKKNLIALHKLRTASKKRLSAQQKLSAKRSSNQPSSTVLHHSRQEKKSA